MVTGLLEADSCRKSLPLGFKLMRGGDGGAKYPVCSFVLIYFSCNLLKAQDSLPQQHPGIEGDPGAWDGW